MKAIVIAMVLALALVAGCKDKSQTPAGTPNATETPQAEPAEQAPQMSDEEKVSYSIGLRIAPSLYEVYGVLDTEWFAKGYRDALAENATLITEAEGAKLMETREVEVAESKRKLAKIISDKAQELASNYETQVNSYLTDFKAKEGVTVNPSGLMYKVLEQGQGESPAAYDEVLLHYEGKLVNGTIFDSTYARNNAVSLVVQGTIPGMIEALQTMKPGDHWEVVIPPELAYGERGVGPVPPNSALVFDLKLLEVKKPTEEGAAQPVDGATPPPASESNT